jgi:hypothetical protein
MRHDAVHDALQDTLQRLFGIHGGQTTNVAAVPTAGLDDPRLEIFVPLPNYPPTLQDATIPDPTASFDTKALLRYLPTTGAIGSMILFYFTFWASPPYVPFVPIGGIDTDLFFDDAVSNAALIELRKFIVGFIERVQPDTPQVWQWERHIEL